MHVFNSQCFSSAFRFSHWGLLTMLRISSSVQLDVIAFNQRHLQLPQAELAIFKTPEFIIYPHQMPTMMLSYSLQFCRYLHKTHMVDLQILEKRQSYGRLNSWFQNLLWLG